MVRLPRLAVVLALFAPAVSVAADPARIPDLWHELLTQDESAAARAVLALSATPKETTDFLQQNLLSLKADKGQLAVLVRQLGDRDYHVREAAQRELLAFGRTIRSELEAARATAQNLEAQDRIGRVLGRIRVAEEDEKALAEGDPLLKGGNAYPQVSRVGNQWRISINGKPVDLTPRVVVVAGPPPMYLRAARAIAVLEFIGTPDAVRLLHTVADGEPAAPPTRRAREALARLKGRR